MGVPVSHKVQILLNGGLFYAESVLARDTELSVPIYAVSKSDLTVRVVPGLTAPLGAVSAGLSFTALSTGSYDPTLGVDLYAGGSWMFTTSAYVRAPLYAGSDRITQRPFTRLDVGGARRIDDKVLAVGLSGVKQGEDKAGFRTGFEELGVVAALIIPAGERVGITARLRVPLLAEPRVYTNAGGLGLRWVLGNAPEGHEH